MAAGRNAMPAKGTKRTPEEREHWLAAMRATRAARMAAMTPAQRLEALADARRKRSAASREGWRTRRKMMGLPPDWREPPTKVAQVYLADLEAARRLHPDAKKGLRTALQGVALALEAGALEWTGEGWRVL